MPPKKRKAAAGAAINADPPQAKKVRIGSTSVIDDENSLDGHSTRSNSTPAGRPKRATANDSPQYNFVKTRDSTASQPTKPSTTKTPPKPTITHIKTSKPPTLTVNGKRRGRPPKDPPADESTIEVEPTSPPLYTGKKRGRKPKATVEVEVNSEAIPTGDDEADGEVDETQYWLMKAEPQSRMEKGIDVKFSIDDLASRTEPEGWDGVRNPVARNNMRAMRKRDLAFFYHSNCAVPGVAGVMRIVEEHIIDETAFDPNHPYYDPKSVRDKPKWEMVKVEFVKKFDDLVTLKELRGFSAPGGMLAAMQTLKQSRLSVSSVQPAEWRFILDLAGEDARVGQPDITDGYESDTDGEVDTSFSSMQATDGEGLATNGEGVAASIEVNGDTAETGVLITD